MVFMAMGRVVECQNGIKWILGKVFEVLEFSDLIYLLGEFDF